ncbi:GIY-YIG nuclease family protein [Novosphingobium sp.]|uniref:GIY-YIG nuclease family protein n=1 Tax=Novosphingobium sp. TaxID=1874826 RepID=UPI003D126719
MNAWLPILQDRLENAVVARDRLAVSAPHYVYVLCRADGTPFYVGKGVQHRCFHHEAEARTTDRLTHKLNVIRAMGRRGEAVRYCIESTFQTEAEAHARERQLIRLFGRHDLCSGPLTNQTDGGEGASNPSEESRERRRQSLYGEAEDEERKVANRWFQSLCNVRSVPIKALGGSFKPERLHANRQTFPQTSRQAAALAAAAIANPVLIEEGAIIPRLMTVDGIAMSIENGAGRDMLSSGLATLADETVGREQLALTRAGYQLVIATVGRETLEGAGVLVPALEAKERAL